MKDDKKKLIVVIALATVIVGVGAFQFLGGSSPAPAGAKAQKKDSKASAAVVAENDVKNVGFTNDLPARDPFSEPVMPDSKPAQQQAQPQPQPTPHPHEDEDKGPVLPPMQIDPHGSLGNGMSVQPLPEAKFGFTLSGVMLGAKPMAVFTDAQGNQRLIMMGGSLDPDSQVTSIEKDAVTVRFHGKTLRLTVEGNPNGK